MAWHSLNSLQNYSYQSRGLLFSVGGHVLLVLTFFIGSFLSPDDMGPEVVYSVTVEGGEQLGGLSQIEDKKNKEKPAPPKPESSKAEEQKKVVKEEKTEEKTKEVVEEEEAEISLKQEVKPTVKPTPVKKEAEKKPEEKATPKAQPTVKAEPTKSKQQEKIDLDKEYQQAMQRYKGESSDGGGQGFGAARLGGKGMGGGELRPPEFFIYRDLIKKTVKKNWAWFDTSTSLRANVTFYISEAGEISDVKLVKSSGNSLFDDSLVRAVMKSSPLSAPPANVYQWFKFIRMEFDPLE